MRSHLCNWTDEWDEGTVNECGCAHGRGTSSSILNRTGYEMKVRVRKEDSPPGTSDVRHRDHFDGAVDGKVRPEPLKFTMSRSEMGL